MTTIRLTQTARNHLDSWLTKALADGRFLHSPDSEVAEFAQRELHPIPVGKNHIASARRRLGLLKGRGRCHYHIKPTRTDLSSASRQVRIAALNWLTFLDENGLLELSLWETWPFVEYDPADQSFHLLTDHGPITGRMSTWRQP